MTSPISKEDLPFLCDNCGEKFGFGDGMALLSVVRSLPFNDEPTPCCGHKISGVLTRDDNGKVEIELDNSGRGKE